MDIFDIYQREKRNSKLTPLKDHFYKKLSEQLRRYNKLIEAAGDNTEEVRRLQVELFNMKEITREIIFLRLDKLLKLALFEIKEDIQVAERSDFTSEEYFLFDIISNILRNYKKYVINRILSGDHPDLNAVVENTKPIIEKKARPKNVLVRFVKEFSQIVGPDMKVYGPFMPEDICALPKEVAKNFIELGVCEVVEINE